MKTEQEIRERKDRLEKTCELHGQEGIEPDATIMWAEVQMLEWVLNDE